MIQIKILIIFLIIAAAIYAYKRSKPVFFGIAWFFVTLFPLSGIVFPTNAIVSEHFMYFPLMGIAMIIGTVVKRSNFILFVIALIYFSALTIRQNMVWLDEFTFFKHTLKFSPNNPKLHLNFGNTYADYRMYDKALQEYKTALSLSPDYAPAYNNMGLIYMERGQFDEAIRSYKKALEIEPDYEDAKRNLEHLLKEK